MKELRSDPIFQTLFVLAIVFISMQIGINLQDWYHDTYEPPECNSGIIKERVNTLEPTEDPNVSIEVQYYLIKCTDGRVQRIESNRTFPIGIRINKEWTR